MLGALLWDDQCMPLSAWKNIQERIPPFSIRNLVRRNGVFQDTVEDRLLGHSPATRHPFSVVHRVFYEERIIEGVKSNFLFYSYEALEYLLLQFGPLYSGANGLHWIR